MDDREEQLKNSIAVAESIGSESGVSDVFNRKNYTDSQKMKKVKESYFGGKKTAKDFYNDNNLHIDSGAAKRKYKGNATKHQADLDHTLPEKKAYDFAKRQPYVTDGDVKKAVNREHNLKVTNAHDNRSKGADSNAKSITKSLENGEVKSVKAPLKKVSEGVKEEVLVKGEIVTKSVAKQILNDTPGIAQKTASVHLAKYIEGESTLAEATVNTIKDTAKGEIVSIATRESVALTQAGIESTQKILVKSLGKKQAEKVIGGTVSKALTIVSNHAGTIATAVVVAGESVIKCVSGDISPEELCTSLAETGVNMVATDAGAVLGGAIGVEIGTTIGAIVGSVTPLTPVGGAVIGALIGDIIGNIVGGAIAYIASSRICQNVRMILNSQQDIAILNKYRDMYHDYARQIEESRIELEEYLKYLHREQQTNIKNGFLNMKAAIENDDCYAINDAINFICEQFRIKTQFQTFDFFKEKMADNNYVFKIGN